MMSKTIKIIKNRSDLGAGTRGADMGIDAIEVAAINEQNDYFTQYEFEDLETENESIYNKVNNSFGKRIKQVYGQCVRLSTAVSKSLKENKFPLVISGDHSSALGTISGIKAANPDKRLGVVWIDAHADIHSPYTSPSGNIHGMPLAAALSEDNIACKINNISEDTFNKTMGNVRFLPKVIEYDRFQPEFYEDTKKYISKRTSKQNMGMCFFAEKITCGRTLSNKELVKHNRNTIESTKYK